MRHILIVIFMAFILSCCCKNIGVIQHEGLSRSYLYLSFEALSGTFESIREVGGEHTDLYYFMLPEDSVYEISISSIKGNASAFLEQNDDTLWSTSGKTIAEQRHKIIGQNLWRLTLSVTAHPVDTYTLRIYKAGNGF